MQGSAVPQASSEGSITFDQCSDLSLRRAAYRRRQGRPASRSRHEPALENGWRVERGHRPKKPPGTPLDQERMGDALSIRFTNENPPETPSSCSPVSSRNGSTFLRNASTLLASVVGVALSLVMAISLSPCRQSARGNV